MQQYLSTKKCWKGKNMSDNPLKQYFRRPSIYIKLPSGGIHYTTEDLEPTQNGELPVYPMSAIDEITSRTPDGLYNGEAVANIIKSCVPAIKNPWAINSIDIEAILIAIRIASTGDEMDIVTTCPSCNEESKFGVNMSSILASKKNVDYSQVLKLRDLEIKFRPLTYAESNKNSMVQFEVQKMLVDLNSFEDGEERNKKTKEAVEWLNDLTTDILTTSIEYIRTPEVTVTNKDHIKEFLYNSDRQTSAAIRDFSLELRSQSDPEPLHIKCLSCGHQYKQPLILNMSDFFA